MVDSKQNSGIKTVQGKEYVKSLESVPKYLELTISGASDEEIMQLEEQITDKWGEEARAEVQEEVLWAIRKAFRTGIPLNQMPKLIEYLHDRQKTK